MTTLEYEEFLLEKMIRAFKEEVMEKIGREIDVQFKEVRMKSISLSDMLAFFNSLIPTIPKLPGSITHRNRSREMTNLKKLYSKLAIEMGYTCTSIAKVLYPKSNDHSTVLYNIEEANNLLITDDGFKELYKYVKNKLIDDFRLNEPSYKERIDPKSVLRNGLLQGQRSAVWSEYLPGVEAVEEC